MNQWHNFDISFRFRMSHHCATMTILELEAPSLIFWVLRSYKAIRGRGGLKQCIIEIMNDKCVCRAALGFARIFLIINKDTIWWNYKIYYLSLDLFCRWPYGQSDAPQKSICSCLCAILLICLCVISCILVCSSNLVQSFVSCRVILWVFVTLCNLVWLCNFE